MLRDGDLSELNAAVAGPVPEAHPAIPEDEDAADLLGDFWDEATGQVLDTSLVNEARKKEIDWIRSIGLYKKIPRREMTSAGFETTSTR